MVCSCPTLHLGELRHQIAGRSACGIVRDVRGQLALERGALTGCEVRILLHERECVLQSRLRIGGIVGPCQAGQIAVPTIEQPGKALTRERERVVVMECEYDIGVPEIRGRVKGGEVRPGVVAPVMPIDYKT